MAIIGSLSVKLGLITVDWDKATDKAKQQAKSLQSAFEGLSAGVRKGAELWKQYGTIAGSVSLVSAIASTIQFTDEISDLARGFDLTIGQTLAFRDALLAGGVSSDRAAKMMSSLFSVIDDARKGTDSTIAQFEKLGISFTDLKTMAPYDAIKRVAEGFKNLTNQIEKTKAIKDFFSKAGLGINLEDVSKALEEGTSKFDNYGEKIKKVGMIHDDLKRSFDNLQIAIADLIGNFSLNKVISIETYSAALKGLAAGAVTLGILSMAAAFIKLGLAIREAVIAGALFNLVAGPTSPIGLAIKLLAIGATAIVFFASMKDSKESSNKAEGKVRYTPEQIEAMKEEQLTEQFSKEATAKKLQLSLNKELARIDIQRAKISYDFLNQDAQINKLEIERLDLKQRGLEIDSKMNQELVLLGDTGSKQKIQSIKDLAAQEKIRLKDNSLERESLIIAKSKYEIQQKMLESNVEYLKASVIESEEDTPVKAEERAMVLEQQLNLMRFQVKESARLNNLSNERLALETSLLNLMPRERDLLLEQADLAAQIKEYRYQAKLAGEIDSSIESMVKIMRDTGEATIRLKQETIDAQRSFEYGWSKAFNAYIDNANNAATMAADMFNTVTSQMSSAIDNFVKTGKISFSSLAQSIIRDLIAIQLKAQASMIFKSALSFLGNMFGGGGAEQLSGPGWKPKAEGGPVSAGKSFLVGERGPELFVPNRSGTVIPNNQMAAAMGGGQTVNYNGPYIASMSAIDTQSGVQFLARNKNTIWASYQSANRSIPVSR